VSRERLPEVPRLVPPGATFAFGGSPFRVKGVLYQGTQQFFQEHLHGGLEALVADIREPELQAFLAQKFLPSGWYDVMPVPALIAYESRALRMSLREYLAHRTRFQARRDLSGVYAWLLRLATPGLVASQLPKIMSQMFDFVRPESRRTEDHSVEMHFHGIPAVLEEWLHTVTEVYAETAMKLAGARSVSVSASSLSADREHAGVRVVTLSTTVGWE
jgi:hypothetical protein